MSMKDINQLITEKASGACRLNPDEQKKFLETFAERVIATCSIEEANSPAVLDHFQEILTKITEEYQPVFVKISPRIETKPQIRYMKIAQELGCQTTIVSMDCENSPFGFVIHTDHLVNVEHKDLLEQFPTYFNSETQEKPAPKKAGFWSKLFG